MATLEFVAYLKSVYDQRKKKNPKYSLRAFASSLGLHSAALSTILSGKRKVSTEFASRLLDQLDVSPAKKIELLGVSIGISPAVTPKYTEVDLKRFAIVRDWEHSAILASFEIDPHLTPALLAKKLSLPTDRVRQAIDRLTLVGLLEQKDGAWISVEPHQATTPEVPSDDVREAHRQFMEKAAESLRTDPVSVRDFSGTTITFDPKKLPEIRNLIRDFRRELVRVASKGSPTSVYRLNVQLFPLSKEI